MATTPYDDDEISRILWGYRQGQLTRFEGVLLAALGVQFAQHHPWSEWDWFQDRCRHNLKVLHENSIEVGISKNEGGSNDA